MGILNIFMDPSSRPNQSNGDFLQLTKSSGKKERIYFTPFSHLLQIFSIKFLKNRIERPRDELRALSRRANVRCIDCGWKYNFLSINQCPVCASDRTYLLNNGSFLAGVATISIVITGFCGFIILAYRAITS